MVMKKIIFAIFVSFLFANSSFAQVKDKSYKNWTVYTTTLEGNKACYIASFPKKKSGNYTRRDEPYFLVTKIGSDTYEVSTSSGYPYKRKSSVKVDVDGNKFNMFTKGELAWASDSDQDSKMINFMKAKSNMTVRGTSLKGTYSIDRYSLSGFTAAYNRMKQLCN